MLRGGAALGARDLHHLAPPALVGARRRVRRLRRLEDFAKSIRSFAFVLELFCLLVVRHAAVFDRFDDAVTGGTYVGKETIDGTATDHYKLTVDTKAIASAVPSAAAGAVGSIPASETIDVWFDGDGRYKQMSTEVGGETVTESFSQWGEPVQVTAPPAGQVQDMTSLMNGQLGKAGQ